MSRQRRPHKPLRWLLATLWLVLLWAAVLFEPRVEDVVGDQLVWERRLPQLERVELERPGERVVITRADDERFWVKLTVGDGKAARVNESMADRQITTTLFEALRQLKIERAISPAPADDALNAFGLAASQRATVTVWPSGQEPVKLWMGGESVGHQEVYGQRPGRREVLLLNAQTLRPLRFASTRLPSRSLTSFTRDKLTGMRLSQPQMSALTIVQHHPQDPELAYWGWERRAGASRAARAWSSDALRLKHKAQVVEEPATGWQERLRWELLVAGVAREQVVLYQDTRGQWAARSEQTLNRLMRVDEADAQALFERALALWTMSQSEQLMPAPTRHADGHVH